MRPVSMGCLLTAEQREGVLTEDGQTPGPSRDVLALESALEELESSKECIDGRHKSGERREGADIVDSGRHFCRLGSM